MLSHARRIHRFVPTAIIAASLAGCASSADFSRSLGVMPLRPPPPVWLGSVHTNSGTPIAGAAAATPTQSPGWAHVLISLGDASAGGVYSWSLHSGSCASQGGVVGPTDRYGEFAIHADGTGAADALVPLTLSPAQTYAVVATPVSSVAPANAAGACADLVLSPL